MNQHKFKCYHVVDLDISMYVSLFYKRMFTGASQKEKV